MKLCEPVTQAKKQKITYNSLLPLLHFKINHISEFYVIIPSFSFIV